MLSEWRHQYGHFDILITFLGGLGGSVTIFVLKKQKMGKLGFLNQFLLVFYTLCAYVLPLHKIYETICIYILLKHIECISMVILIYNL